MIFNSVTFLLFFVAFFFIYWGINNRANVTVRNVFTILASYLFYGWWDWRFLSLIVISSAVDYSVGVAIKTQSKQILRKILLSVSVVVNLGILATFKYFNFFIDSLSEAFQFFSINLNTSTLNIILPVGISFYTFQTLSYTVDVYKNKLEPTTNIISFFAFVSFFPQLVAGPIERASSLLPQFEVKKKFDAIHCISGLRLTLWGFFKKLVIADNFGVLADGIFESADAASGASILLGCLFFGLQIYADFSGYSDIAIGISKSLGYNLMANFKTPYFAQSLNEFWQRWHISLSTWFRDYVYIPLGGNRKSSGRVQLNLLITFLLSGLWHGASMTFVIWGALHGVALVIEKQINFKLNKWIAGPIVVVLVFLFWLPFRAESTSQLLSMVHSITDFTTYSFTLAKNVITEFSALRFTALSVITLLFFVLESKLQLLNFHHWIERKNRTFRFSVYYLLLFAILFLGNFTVKPSFIYFQF